MNNSHSMTGDRNLDDEIKKEQMLIFEMIEASIELAEQKGKHPLENDCNCISCINLRKLVLFNNEREWKFKL